MALAILNYEIKDFGSYKIVEILYNKSSIITNYSVDDSEWMIEKTNRIGVPCTSKKIEIYGTDKGNDYSENIVINLESKKIVSTQDMPEFSSMVEQKTSYNNGTFDSLYFVDLSKEGVEVLSLPRRINRKELNNPITVIVDKSMENRIDYIAEKYLGDGRLWWIIAEFNNIINPSILKIGTSLNIPDVSEIYGVDGPLRSPDISAYNN